MPNHDGTGPDGKGPITGWGRGNCVLPLSGPEQELPFLANQAQALQKQLRRVRARIKLLEKQKVTK
jgi:hypothetical protein